MEEKRFKKGVLEPLRALEEMVGNERSKGLKNPTKIGASGA